VRKFTVVTKSVVFMQLYILQFQKKKFHGCLFRWIYYIGFLG